ncbi:hypothetical protein [Actinomyces sp. MRS3W]|uniref:hypothetical protein n=1 Tax=Actinomyces sp. MRS3W TaxID=2800796 RepID=UPI0028FD31C8|nr:hypothetical protein [Actinomyces sp. MRS3W]MDU0347492.1 hypothetical protein [Actinomyces sp. MRS3W]
MTITGWIGATSGLPSLYLETGTTTSVYAGERLLDVVDAGAHLMADALAEPGVSTVYTAGAESVTLIRPEGAWWGVHVCDASGRSVPGLAYRSNQDPVSWTSTVTRFNRRVVRWAIEDEPRTGEGVIVLDDPDREEALWRVLQSHGLVYLVPASRTAGVPPRCVTVDSAKRTRLSDDLIEVTVAWTEASPVSETAGLGAVPVTTWGEWQAYADAHGEGGWQDYSALQVARLVQGMPA